MSTVKSGGWAEKSGEVQSGDVIVSVGGRKVDGNMMDLKGLTKLIQGEEDTAVKIVLVRAGGEEREWYLAGSGLVDHEGGLRELRLAEAVRRVRGALAAQEEEVALARRVRALPRVRA